MSEDLIRWLRNAIAAAERDADPEQAAILAAHRHLIDLYKASAERDQLMRGAIGSAPLAAATGAYRECLYTIAPLYERRPGYNPTHPGYNPAWRPAVVFDATNLT